MTKHPTFTPLKIQIITEHCCSSFEVHCSNCVVGEDDFHYVKDAVSSLTAMWREFGSVLGLGLATIKDIKAMHPDPVSCLNEVLKRWLKEDYNRYRFPPPSWRQLVCAVQSKSGGMNPALARKIAPQHPSNKRHLCHNKCSLPICLFFSTEKEKTSENKFGQSSAELHPVIIEPTIPQQVPLRQTQLEELQPSGPLLQPRNVAPFTNPSKEVNTVVQVTAQEGTGQLITIAYHLMHRSLVMILHSFVLVSITTNVAKLLFMQPPTAGSFSHKLHSNLKRLHCLQCTLPYCTCNRSIAS